ncbi:probable polygalacturonase At3g15720 [Impatiens glandulifera]|uniref:probable polygalacturonase At3g15720 n=1 Tax=Impatiens glandulifera TaxID=253017 RepID=UPI001FB0C234|nr:probable polygalacturonase At3g15720 [Impatiens glandulifera]
MGDIRYILGVEATRTFTRLFPSQVNYISTILKRVNMMDTKSLHILVITRFSLSKHDEELLSDPLIYRSIVGALQYLTLSFHELAFAVNQGYEFRVTLNRPPILWCNNISVAFLIAKHVFHAHILTKGLSSKFFAFFHDKLIVCVTLFGLREDVKQQNSSSEWLNTILTFSCSLLLILDLTLAVTFDVTEFGANGNGNVDDSQAFLQAWDKTCASSSNATMVVPEGNTYLLIPLQFNGPCKGPSVQVQIDGTLVAPKTIGEWTGCVGNTWIGFSDVDGLQVYGNGTLDGQGSLWWKKSGSEDDDHIINNHNRKKKKRNMCSRPMGLKFSSCKNLELSGLTHINPPKRHINLHSCNQVTISCLTITAPKDSPNTDGISISSSTNVNITNSTIGTGDDCIAICSGSSNIFVEGVQCGPGHGISVGSLGEGGSQNTVEDVHILNCNFTGTQNGARIKTWQGGKGYARNITFEHIQLNDVKNSIIIDQNYCNGKHDCTAKSGAVEVSNVKYINVQGTSTIDRAILLDCSNEVPCNNIVFDNVNITSSSMGVNVYATCKNANVSVPSVVYPVVSCSIGDI